MWLFYILVLAELYFASGGLALGRRILSVAEPQTFKALLDILSVLFKPMSPFCAGTWWQGRRVPEHSAHTGNRTKLPLLLGIPAVPYRGGAHYVASPRAQRTQEITRPGNNPLLLR